MKLKDKINNLLDKLADVLGIKPVNAPIPVKVKNNRNKNENI